MTDSTVKMKSGNTEGETVATCSTVVLMLLFDFLFQVKSAHMTWGGRVSNQTMLYNVGLGL